MAGTTVDDLFNQQFPLGAPAPDTASATGVVTPGQNPSVTVPQAAPVQQMMQPAAPTTVFSAPVQQAPTGYSPVAPGTVNIESMMGQPTLSPPVPVDVPTIQTGGIEFWPAPKSTRAGAQKIDPFGQLGQNVVTDDEADGSLLGKIGGGLLSAFGSVPYLAGTVVGAAEDRIGLQRDGVATWLRNNGKAILDAGQDLTDASTSEKARAVGDSMMREFTDADENAPLFAKALRAVGHLGDEGGGEFITGQVVGMATAMVGGGLYGTAARGVASLTAKGLAAADARILSRVAARAEGKTVVDATGAAIAPSAPEAALSAATGAGVARSTMPQVLDDAAKSLTEIPSTRLGRAAQNFGNSLRNPQYIGMAAAQGGMTASQTEDEALKQLQSAGANRFNMAGWKATRDAMIAATGQVPTDQEVDARFARGLAAQSGVIATGSTLGLTAFSPLSEGAFARVLSGQGLGSFRPTVAADTADTMLGRTRQLAGRVAGGALREGSTEALDEAIQSGMSSPEAIQAAMNGKGTVDQLMTGMASPSGLQGATLGGLLGGAFGGAIGGISRVDPNADPVGQAIAESGRRVRAAGDEQTTATDAERAALQRRADGGDARAAQQLQLIDQEAQNRKRERDEAIAEFERQRQAKLDAARRDATTLNNGVKLSALLNVTHTEPAELGANASFGVTSTHGPFTGSDTTKVVFSTSQGAIAVDTDASKVVYASAEQPDNWVDIKDAPDAWQRIARPAAVMGSQEASPDLTFQQGIDIAAAMPVLQTAYDNSSVLDDTSAALQRGAAQAISQRQQDITSAADLMQQNLQQRAADVSASQAALAVPAEVDPSIIATQQDEAAFVGRTLPVTEWQKYERSRETRGLLVPPAGAFDPRARIGLYDYKLRLQQVYAERAERISRRLFPPTRQDGKPDQRVEQAFRNWVYENVPDANLTDPTINFIAQNRADEAFLRRVASGEQQRLPGWSGRSRGARAVAINFAQQLANQHELLHLYQSATTETRVPRGRGRAAEVTPNILGMNMQQLTDTVQRAGQLENPALSAQFDADVRSLIEAKESELASTRKLQQAQGQAAALDASAQAQLDALDEVQARIAQQMDAVDAQASAALSATDQASAALAAAENLPEIMRSLSFLAPEAEVRGTSDSVNTADQLGGLGTLLNTAVPINAVNRAYQLDPLLSSVKDTAPAAREGANHRYGMGSRIAPLAPTTEMQQAYNTALQDLGIAQLALRIRDGENAESIVRSMITDYGVSLNSASNYYLQAVDMAASAGSGDVGRAALVAKVDARRKVLDDQLVAAMEAARPDIAEAVRNGTYTPPGEAAAVEPTTPTGTDIASMLATPGAAEQLRSMTRQTAPLEQGRTMASGTGDAIADAVGIDYVSRPTGYPVGQVTAFAARKRAELAHLSNSLNIVVHNTEREAQEATGTPHSNFAMLTEEPNQRNGNRTTIHIVAEHIRDEAQMERKFRHELLGHYALHRLLGPSINLLRDKVVDLVQYGKDGQSKLLRQFFAANRAKWRDAIEADEMATFGEIDPQRVNNRLDANNGYIAEETLASLIEYSQENRLAGKAAAPIINELRGLLNNAGLSAANANDIADIISQADGYLNNTQDDLIKRLLVAADTRSSKAYERAQDDAVIQRGIFARMWGSLTSDMAGIRQLVALVQKITPDQTERAEGISRMLESAQTRVVTEQSRILDSYVAPLKRSLAKIKKELHLREEEVYAYFSAYMIGRHAGERNRSYFIVHNKSGFSDRVVAARDAIYQEAVNSSNPQVWATALQRMEDVIRSNPQSSAALDAYLSDPDIQGVAGISQREVNSALASIPDAFKKALERSDAITLHDGAQSAILELRRLSGAYGDTGYRKIKVYGWKAYVPLTKEEGAYYVGDTSNVTGSAVLKSQIKGRVDNPEGSADSMLPDGTTDVRVGAWIDGDVDMIYQKRDRARVIEGQNPTRELLPTIMHTLEQDAYYASHELISAEIGREAAQLGLELVTQVPSMAKRIQNTLIEVGPRYEFNGEPVEGPRPDARNAYVVTHANGDRQVIRFNDDVVARSFGSRFIQPFKDNRPVQGMMGVTRFLSRAFTSYNPAWVWFRQFPRDIQQNILIAMSEHGVDFASASSILPKALGYIAPMEQFFFAAPEVKARTLEAARKDAKHPLHTFALRYDEGGIPLYDDALLSQVRGRNVTGSEFNTTGEMTIEDLGGVRLAVRNTGSLFRATGAQINAVANSNASAFDHAARQALFDVVYAKLKKDGTADAKAVTQATQAVNSTLNFANRSAAGRALSPFFAFAQTALTSLDAIAENRLWKGGKIPRVAMPDGNGGYKVRLAPNWASQLNKGWIAGRVVMGALSVGAMAALLSATGNDDRSEFDKLDLQTLLTNIVLPNPMGGDPIRIPIQVGFDSLFHSFGAAAALSMISNGPAHNGSIWSELGKQAIAALTPFATAANEDLDVSQVLNTVVPTVLQPVFAAFGSSRLGETLDDVAGVAPPTSINPMLVDASRALEELTGMQIAPTTARQILASYGGGIWRAIDSGTKYLYTRDENMQLVDDAGPLSALTNFLGFTSRDGDYDPQQSYYYFVGVSKQLQAMVQRAKAMDAYGPDFEYSPLNPSPNDAPLRPNMAAFNQKYGLLYGYMRQQMTLARDELSSIKTQVDVARGTGNEGQVGALLAREKQVYSLTAQRLRAAMTDPRTGDLRELQEPRYQRWWAN